MVLKLKEKSKNIFITGDHHIDNLLSEKIYSKNENARRVGLAQQKLHEEMIKSQYDK